MVNTGLRGKGTKRYVYPNMLLVRRVGMNHFLLSILDYEGRELKGMYTLTCCWYGEKEGTTSCGQYWTTRKGN